MTPTATRSTGLRRGLTGDIWVLPGSSGDSRLVELKEPYVTNLKPLNGLLQLTKRNGSHGMKLPQGRSIIASSLPAMIGRLRNDMERGARFLDVTRQQAYKRAGIDKVMHHVKGYSGDTASRSPIMAPGSIYPVTPTDCAGLIRDFLFFDRIVSGDALVESLGRAGLRGEVLLAPAHGNLRLVCPLSGHTGETARLRGMPMVSVSCSTSWPNRTS